MDFHTIHPREMEHIMQRKRAAVIDVREREVYQQYHFPKAVSLPYDQIDIWMKRLTKSQPLILYCDYGSTSLLAARKLGKEGFEVYTVIGGMDAMKRFFGA